MTSLIAAFAFPWLTGFSLLRWMRPIEPGVWDKVFRLALSWGLGLGCHSSLLFLWLLLFGAFDKRFAFLEMALAVLAMFFLFFRKHRGLYELKKENSSSKGGPIEKKLKAAFLILGTSGMGIMFLLLLLAPHGDWDAWAIWNHRARFIFRAGEDWPLAFSPLLAWSHPDYPLLLPLSVARCWLYWGKESLWIPAAVAIGFSLSVVLILVSALVRWRNTSQGYLGGILLLSHPAFLTHGVSQYADIPLAFYFLTSLVILAAYDRSSVKPKGLLVLAGLLAGFSAWTKNEGLGFVLILLLLRAIPLRILTGSAFRWKEAAFLGAGLLFPMTLLFIFKCYRAPMNDLLVGRQADHLLQNLIDLQRNLLIAKAFGAFLFSVDHWPWTVTPFLVAYIFCIGRSPHPVPVAKIFFPLILQLLVYYAVFLLTPHDLVWHLGTAAGRLFLQLWPSFLFGLLVALKTPEEAWEVFHLRRKVAR